MVKCTKIASIGNVEEKTVPGGGVNEPNQPTYSKLSLFICQAKLN